MIALARTRELTFATAGPGSVAHMSGELLARETGIRLEHVPYPGDAAAFPDVVSGRVNFRVGSWSDDRQHVQSGALKLLAVFYPHRLPDFPNTPTVTESVPSMGNYPAGVFNSIVVPARVPEELVAQISDGLRRALASDGFKQRISALGLYPRYTTVEETAVFLRNQVTTWSEIARSAGILIQ
ncbi:tripartite tricarboxylate transporter family receptor [Humitalea rosea]|uniref:Tripartite tricarboxylate transporter family receptor n=1 Tax=Humitalea rosea TaxID=990373 RepID=A0A2W7IDH5_9PROT|nr:tripartite tricarboxylate transporter family receptor [Humitalea rosea]